MFCECRYYYRYRPLRLAKLRKNENVVHHFWGILPSGQLYEVPKWRRTAVREAERSLRSDPEEIATQRFGAWRRRGF
jgi:hypothetical protein